jgi:septum formation protein
MTPEPNRAPPALILASASASRAAMLRNAGLTVTIAPTGIDEDTVKRSVRGEGGAVADAAQLLAELKARRISQREGDALVIGADQMLECDGDWFDKAESLAGARSHLQKLRGRSHMLLTAAVVVRGDTVIWSKTDTATLTMRPFSDAFLDGYLERIGDEALETVGCYRLEGPGAQLFSRIDGDFFTILGLPLLPLLDFLRGHGILVE